MREFELIERLKAQLPVNDTVVIGAGDDCAVLKSPAAETHLLLKTDSVVEGVHFRSDESPGRIGHKALARPLSDIAAMAGTPTSAVVAISLPERLEPAYVEDLYSGINALARRHGVAIVGGETTLHPHSLALTVSVLGTVPRDRCLLRRGGRVGDALFVTGDLGGSLTGKHLDFEPRLPEAQWLAEHFPLRSMIDISDGLAGDLRHILEASQVGAELLTSAIPISRAAKQAARSESSAKPPLLAALTDGEDFELLFSVAASHAVALLDQWKHRFPNLRLSCVGKLTAEAGIRLRDKQGLHPLTARGYDHFA